MDPKLQNLIRQLQDEKCPATVRDRVALRIAREKSGARSGRASLAWAVALAGVIGAVVLWQQQIRREARARANRAVVVEQTQVALGYIGQAFLRAAAHTGNALSKEAGPPLRNGFETVKNKVTNPI